MSTEDKVIKLIRCLVISKKPPCLVTDIVKDYKNMEGEPLPYKSFGYRNVEEFLAASNAFVLEQYRGDVSYYYYI